MSVPPPGNEAGSVHSGAALSHATGPTEPPLRELTLGELLRWAAETTPERLALIAGTPDPALRREWTYAELYAESVRTARALRRSFEPGERVAVWAANVPEWIMLEFGAAMAGLVLVTVNPGFRAAELEYVLQQSRSSGIFVQPEFHGNPMLETVQKVAPACTTLREVVSLDTWEAFVATGDDTTIELPRVFPDDAVMIQYTSGTTGFPKGALLHHRGIVNNGAHTFDRMGIADGAITLSTMPLFHTGGCVLCVLGSVSRRTTQVLVEAFEPGLVLELMQTYHINTIQGVPTMLIALMEHADYARTDLSSTRAICSGGSTVPAELVRRFEEKLGAPFVIVFGQTECSPVASMTRPDDTIVDKAETVGPPMPHVEIKIADPATGEPVPIGEVGEYCTRGYHVMLRYFDKPEDTAAAIDEDGWLHTGDLCSMDERGYCRVEGRLKDMIIRGGENIYPRELEELLFRHPSISNVAIVGLPDERLGESVAAFVRPATGATIDRDELTAYMRESLAPHKTPKRWFIVDDFPMTGSGKVQKFRLRELWQKGELQEL